MSRAADAPQVGRAEFERATQKSYDAVRYAQQGGAQAGITSGWSPAQFMANQHQFEHDGWDDVWKGVVKAHPKWGWTYTSEPWKS